MALTTVLVAGLVVTIGLAGTVVPLLPGLSLIWLAAAASWWLTGWSAAATITMVALTVLLAGGSAAKYWLPSRAARGAGVERRSLVLGLLLGLPAAVAIPVVGFPLGFVGGLYLAERGRLADPDDAWDTTVATLRGFGIGVLIELGAGLAMAAVWLTIALAAP